MDEPDAGSQSDPPGLESRPPTDADLVNVCRELNRLGAKYVVVGGFAVILAGFPRATGDLDLLIEAGAENEERVFQSLEILPDKAVQELTPGEVEQYTVVRVADEIVVDLMKSACGIGYAEAALDSVVREICGVPIPFASPRLLWRMKKPTMREKDAGDVVFLREYFRQRGEEPPAV
jgi:hypothetical protein